MHRMTVRVAMGITGMTFDRCANILIRFQHKNHVTDAAMDDLVQRLAEIGMQNLPSSKLNLLLFRMLADDQRRHNRTDIVAEVADTEAPIEEEPPATLEDMYRLLQKKMSPKKYAILRHALETGRPLSEIARSLGYSTNGANYLHKLYNEAKNLRDS